MNEEIIYCSECGAANKASAVVCSECEKKIRARHLPFIRFMKENVRDKIIGKIEDKGIDILKGYILSHIYGVVMTVFLVTAGVAFAVPKGTVYTPDEESIVPAPQIEKEAKLEAEAQPLVITETEKETVNTPQAETAETVVEEAVVEITPTGPVETIIESADKNAIWAITRNYQKQADYLLGGYGSDTGESITSFYAQNVPGFSYSGRHDMATNGVRNADKNKQAKSFGTRGIRTFLTGDNLTSPLAITLRDNGYEVCEGVFTGGLNFGDTPVDTSNIEACDIVLRYRIVCVKLSGSWYIAEDVLM